MGSILKAAAVLLLIASCGHEEQEPCEDWEWRCSDETFVERCSDGIWTVLEDCSLCGGDCGFDRGGSPVCYCP